MLPTYTKLGSVHPDASFSLLHVCHYTVLIPKLTHYIAHWEQFCICFGFELLHQTIGFKTILPLCHLIRRKNKTHSRQIFTLFFFHILHQLNSLNKYFEFWLVHWIFRVSCDCPVWLIGFHIKKIKIAVITNN